MLCKEPHRRWRGTSLKYTLNQTTGEVRTGGQGREEAITLLTQLAPAGRMSHTYCSVITFSWVCHLSHHFLSRVSVFYFDACLNIYPLCGPLQCPHNPSQPLSFNCSLMLLKKSLLFMFSSSRLRRKSLRGDSVGHKHTATTQYHQRTHQLGLVSPDI